MIDWQTIIIAGIAALPPTIIAWRTGQRVDGRMDELLQAAKDAARAEGTVAEQGAEHGRKVARAKARKTK